MMEDSMRKAALVLLSAFVVVLPGSSGQGQEARQEPKKLDRAITKELGDLMKRKLESSQKVLEGVALGDFDKVAMNAEDLIAISKKAEWKVLKTPRYTLHTNEFQRTAEELAQRAKEKNLDGAALAYVDLTLTCVKCHKHVRETRNVRLDSKEPFVVGAR
jgi:hypothetical protein